MPSPVECALAGPEDGASEERQDWKVHEGRKPAVACENGLGLRKAEPETAPGDPESCECPQPEHFAEPEPDSAHQVADLWVCRPEGQAANAGDAQEQCPRRPIHRTLDENEGGDQ